MGRVMRHLEQLNNEAREKARAAGAVTYNGHPHSCGGVERFVVNGGCVACNRIRGRSSAHRQAVKRWYAANTEQHKLLRDAWREEHREDVRKWNDQYRREHLRMYTAFSRAYTLHKQRAMPAWADRKAIQRIYEECPAGHQVDHIIPLRGKSISGLHVETNLQYLPGVENNRKGNQYAAG